jgi:hypothetical protein
MMRVVLSLCNERRNPEQGVLLFDVVSKDAAWIPVGASESIMGTRGVCVDGDFLYVVYTVGWYEAHVATFVVRSELIELVDDKRLPDVSDPHSICVFNDRLLVTSTGTDEIVAYDLDDRKVTGNAESFWRASDAGSDTHHVNSVCTDGSAVIVSAFGPREGELWSSARSGYIYNITEQRMILSDLQHPHSARIFDGVLYFDESSRQSLRTASGGRVIIGGYVRGCERLRDGTMLVGSNAARRVSRSRGVVTNAANIENTEGERVGSCSLVRVGLGAVPLREFIDVSAYGLEIYDIAALPEAAST